MAVKKTTQAPNVTVTSPKNSEDAMNLFYEAKQIYLNSEQTPEILNRVIEMFESASVLDPNNKDAAAYLSYAKRDLSGLQKKKKGSVSGASGKNRSKSHARSEDITLSAAYETNDDGNLDEDVELYGEDDEAEAPPWEPVVPNSSSEDEQHWERS